MLPETVSIAEKQFCSLFDQPANRGSPVDLVFLEEKSRAKRFSVIFTDTSALLIEGHSMVSHDLERDGKVDTC